MKATSASILGCGWLGLPLAKRLIADSCSVKGSTTRPERLSVLTEAGIQAFHIHCSPHIQGTALSEFFQSQLLFLNIPFKRKLESPNIYRQQIESVIEQVHASAVTSVLFASSTSVYPNHTNLALEDDRLKPDNERSEVLHQIEQSLLEDSRFNTIILRFAGLYGGSRQLGRFLQQGRSAQRSGQAPVNLVHLDDCVEIVSRLITQSHEIKNQIFNVCADEHPSRETLYTQKSREMGLDIPMFSSDPPKSMKVVSNQKLKDALNYTFIHPDPCH